MFLLVLMACTEEEEATYTQYNGEDDSVSVEVGVAVRYVEGDTTDTTDTAGDTADTAGATDTGGGLVTETASASVTSSTGALVVGTGTVDPSAGPVGTEHTITIEVSSEYTGDVDRATVVMDSGVRGTDEYEMERDSAGEGVWVLRLESVGESGETRTDTVTFRLYEEDPTEE